MERKRVLITGVRIGLPTAEQLAQNYIACKPLPAREVADTISVITYQPGHVNIAALTILSTDQTSATVVPRTLFHH